MSLLVKSAFAIAVSPAPITIAEVRVICLRLSALGHSEALLLLDHSSIFVEVCASCAWNVGHKGTHGEEEERMCGEVIV